MQRAKLLSAIEEAERFLKRAKDLAKMHKYYTTYGTTKEAPTHIYSMPKEQGSVNRASMDLSRALADLRRAG